MAESTITPQQTNLLKRSSSSRGVLLNHRHQQSTRATRWAMSRSDNMNIGSSGASAMFFWVNPSECQWKLATRTSIEKISGGVVHHEWPQTGMYMGNNSFLGSRYDQPLLSLSFQTGIITAGGYDDILSEGNNETSPQPGLGNFFDFLDLLDRPDTTSSGAPNYIHILYSSPLFGQRGIYLQGFFTEEGVAWTDSAENPNQINSWGATFMVFNMQPSLKQLMNNFELIGIPTA